MCISVRSQFRVTSCFTAVLTLGKYWSELAGAYFLGSFFSVFDENVFIVGSLFERWVSFNLNNTSVGLL